MQNKIFASLKIENKTRLNVNFSVQGEWRAYFREGERAWIDYGTDIRGVPEGVNELLLEYALNNCMEQNAVKIFLYICDICALSQDCIKDDCITLGNDEIRKSVIAQYVAVAEKVWIAFEIRYDSDGELIAEENLGWERIEA